MNTERLLGYILPLNDNIVICPACYNNDELLNNHHICAVEAVPMWHYAPFGKVLYSVPSTGNRWIPGHNNCWLCGWAC